MKNDELSLAEEDQIFEHLEAYRALDGEIRQINASETVKDKSWLVSFQQQGKRDPNAPPTRRGKHVRHASH